MLEVFTVGGGEYLVNTFNAIAAWTGGFGAAKFLPGIPPLNTLLAASAIYLLFARRPAPAA